ncbi:hypothetical protein RRG08_032147 [Elysia crispata]|uniref:Uncharacterized protein n=1 Tax=Elysia crispata TaxID=231223 RepID=A0AAE1ACT1_9GAST|nr:hypothetical protein RRG08_032147 [Elysia crispata]
MQHIIPVQAWRIPRGAADAIGRSGQCPVSNGQQTLCYILSLVSVTQKGVYGTMMGCSLKDKQRKKGISREAGIEWQDAWPSAAVRARNMVLPRGSPSCPRDESGAVLLRTPFCYTMLGLNGCKTDWLVLVLPSRSRQVERVQPVMRYTAVLKKEENWSSRTPRCRDRKLPINAASVTEV